MSFISNRLNYFDSSDFRDAFKKQQLLKHPVDLSIGVPEEFTAEHIKQAGIKAIEEDKTTYTPSNGLLELRTLIAEKLVKENNISCNADTVTVIPGQTTGQLLIYLAILDPGDEIIVLDPYYPPYPHLASMIGAHVVYVSTLPNFQPDIPAIEASITNRTKAIVINSPNNPTGAVYSETTLRKIASLAKEHNFLVISDEIYEHFVYEGKPFSIGSILPNTITINGFSKEFGMTGWRIGYIAGPPEIIDAINELQQYVVMSSSSIGQHAAVAAMTNRPHINGKYKAKRDLLYKELKRIGYTVEGMQGAFYAFIKAPNDLTDIEFVERASDYDLIVVAGRAFSRLSGYFRISYGTDMDTLKKGLKALEELTKNV